MEEETMEEAVQETEGEAETTMELLKHLVLLTELSLMYGIIIFIKNGLKTAKCSLCHIKIIIFIVIN